MTVSIISPLDLMPHPTPFIGRLDDLLVIRISYRSGPSSFIGSLRHSPLSADDNPAYARPLLPGFTGLLPALHSGHVSGV
jgi:hypothetical protein